MHGRTLGLDSAQLRASLHEGIVRTAARGERRRRPNRCAPWHVLSEEVRRNGYLDTRRSSRSPRVDWEGGPGRTRGESPESLVGVGRVRTIHGGTRGEFGYTVRNQAERGTGVRRSTIGGRRSEVGGQAWVRSEDLAKLLATPRATRRCPLFAGVGSGARLSPTGVGRRTCRTEFGVRRRLVLRRSVA